MHFKNHRKSTIINKKQGKPCPYHSRVSSTVDQACNSDKSYRYHRSNRSTPKNSYDLGHLSKQQQKLPRIKLKPLQNSRKVIKQKKQVQSRVIKSQPRQPLIDPDYHHYGKKSFNNIDYYQDLKLNNQGWPTPPYSGKVNYARHSDALIKAQNRVKQIYYDEYHNIREQLEAINRIKQRYKVLRNIQNDKTKLKTMLKQIKGKSTYIQTEADESDYENTSRQRINS